MSRVTRTNAMVRRTYAASLRFPNYNSVADYLAIPASAARSIEATHFAVAFWCRLLQPPLSGTHCVAACGNPNYQSGWLLNQIGADLQVYVMQAGSIFTAAGFYQNDLHQWHRLCFFGNATTAEVRLYKNGVFVANGTRGAGTWSSGTTSDIRIGESTEGFGSISAHFSDFCFHKGTLWTLTDVQNDYFKNIRGPGLSARFLLTEGAGGSAADSQGGAAATLNGGTTWTTDAPMQARVTP